MSRLLAIHPGADYSTADVFTGMVPALRRAGHEVLEYALNERLDDAALYLLARHERLSKHQPDLPKPTLPDAIYRAAMESVIVALRTEPDWVVIFSGMLYHPDYLVLLRRAGIKAALLLSESPYDDAEQARMAPYAEMVFTNERTSVDFLRAFNVDTHYLAHAYDPERHQPGPHPGDEALPAHDVVFVGTAFQERIELLAAVDWTGIDLGLYGMWELLEAECNAEHAAKLRPFLRGGVVDNARTAGLYRRAKIGLNLHRQSRGFGFEAPRILHAESVGPRALELAACGVFQISDHRAELADLFGPNVPAFRTSAELEALVRRYARDATARRQHALSCRLLVAPHTFDARAAQLTEILEAYPACTPPRALSTKPLSA